MSSQDQDIPESEDLDQVPCAEENQEDEVDGIGFKDSQKIICNYDKQDKNFRQLMKKIFFTNPEYDYALIKISEMKKSKILELSEEKVLHWYWELGSFSNFKKVVFCLLMLFIERDSHIPKILEKIESGLSLSFIFEEFTWQEFSDSFNEYFNDIEKYLKEKEFSSAYELFLGLLGSAQGKWDIFKKQLEIPQVRVYTMGLQIIIIKLWYLFVKEWNFHKNPIKKIDNHVETDEEIEGSNAQDGNE